LVRERAANGLGSLLAIPRQDVTTACLQWLGTRLTENASATGLLPFVRAKQLVPELQLPIRDLVNAVTRPSLLSNMLLELLGANADELPSLTTAHGGRPPDGFQADDFFATYAKSYVSPLYSHTADLLSKGFLIPFTRQWQFEWSELMAAGSVAKHAEPLWYRGSRPEDDHLPIGEFPVSEIYLSAFLRALSWALSEAKLDSGVARDVAAEVCPVNADFWTTQPGSKPNWWPSPTAPTGQVDTIAADVWKQVERLWIDHGRLRGGEEYLLAASGRVFEEGDLAYDLDIRAVLQRSVGPKSGQIEAMFDWADQVRVDFHVPPLRLLGSVEPPEPREMSSRFNDWDLIGLSGHAAGRIHGRWHYLRFWRGLRFMPRLAPATLSFQCSDGQIQFSEEAGQAGRWRDWFDGAEERLRANLPPRSGFVLTSTKRWMDELIARSHGAVLWLCKLTCYQRAGRYEQFQEISTFGSFGGTGIVLPR